VPADQALEKAYLMALEKLKEKAASPEEKNGPCKERRQSSLR
jgi:hypothetical protein